MTFNARYTFRNNDVCQRITTRESTTSNARYAARNGERGWRGTTLYQSVGGSFNNRIAIITTIVYRVTIFYDNTYQ